MRLLKDAKISFNVWKTFSEELDQTSVQLDQFIYLNISNCKQFQSRFCLSLLKNNWKWIFIAFFSQQTKNVERYRYCKLQILLMAARNFLQLRNWRETRANSVTDM